MIKGLHHVGVVYKDITEIREKIQDLYGMPEIAIYEAITEVNTYIKELVVPLKIKIGFARMGSTMIELFEPLDDNSTYAEFLNTNSEGGVHHIGILVENIEEELKKWDSRGIKRIMSGALPTNSFVYYDTREMFGYVTELLDDVPPPSNK